MHFSTIQPGSKNGNVAEANIPPVCAEALLSRVTAREAVSSKKKQKTPASKLIHEGETQANARASKHPSLCLQLQVTDTIARLPSLPRVEGWMVVRETYLFIFLNVSCEYGV